MRHFVINIVTFCHTFASDIDWLCRTINKARHGVQAGKETGGDIIL
jgi:hypothetical protein